MNSGVLYLVISILSILTLTCLFLTLRVHNLFNALTKGLDHHDLVSSLESVLKKQNHASSKISQIENDFSSFVQATKSFNSKLGFKRYNPFKDTGGNQSFILCLTDAEGNGVVISSLHSRENTRVYAKPLTRGQSPEQTLSKEEQTVIRDTLKS